MVDYIRYKRRLLGIILRKNFSRKGASFFTEPKDPFQLGVLNYKKGEIIQAHKHIRVKRTIDLVCEALFIQTGKIKITFYNKKNFKIKSKILNAGDMILLKESGHGLKLLKDSKIIEIKQGPYLGKKNDKRYLDI